MKGDGLVDYNDLWGRRDGLVIAVGAGGAVLQSRDSGLSWTKRHSMTRERLVAVSGWRDLIVAVGSNGIIVRSTDGGDNWTTIEHQGADLSSVAVWREGSVVAVGAGGTMLTSADQGRTFYPSQRNDGFGKVHLVDADVDGKGNFFVLNARGVVYGGKPGEWTATELQIDAPQGLAIRRRQVLVFGSNGEMKISTDRGKTWRARRGTTDLSINGALLGTNGRIIAVGPNGTLVCSDEEDAWYAMNVEQEDSFRAIWNDGTGLVMAVGDEGVLIRSEDFGDHWDRTVIAGRQERSPFWESIRTAGHLSGLYVTTAGDVFVVGKGGVIGRTSDRGVSWTVGLADTNKWLYDVYGDDNSLYAAGYRRMLKSDDNGATWHTTKRVRSRYFGRIYGSDETHHYAINDKSLFVLTTGFMGGWQSRSIKSKSKIHGLWADTAQGLFVSGDAGTILHTKSEGKRWAVLNSGTKESLHAITGRSDGLVVAVGDAGMIVRSTDGGQTFESVGGTVRTALRDIYADEETIFTIGDDGVVLRSLDEGATWQLDPSGTDCNLQRISGGSGDVWVLGQDGGEVVLLRRRFVG
jgi:photosystem II stability/assembly factor-like uncharacterized protein